MLETFRFPNFSRNSINGTDDVEGRTISTFSSYVVICVTNDDRSSSYSLWDSQYATGHPKGHTLFVYTTCTGDIRHHLRDLQRACNTMEETNRKICNEDMGEKV